MRQVRHVAGFLLLVGLALSTTGCAFGTRHALLDYQVIRASKPPNGIRIYVATFRDDRPDLQLVGHVLNGWGMKTAQVRSHTNVAEWVRSALTAELKASGYEATDFSSEQNIVGGSVAHIDCTSYLTYEGKVGLDVELKEGNEVTLRKTYFGRADEGLLWAATAKSYTVVLQSALRNALIQVVSDVDWALKAHRQISKKEEKTT